MAYRRALSPDFLGALNDGVLTPLLARVKRDGTLMLALRGDYINIYYRGGNLLKVEEVSGKTYRATFDTKYNKGDTDLPAFPFPINSADDAQVLVREIPFLKYAMDSYFSQHVKAEREFQQLVARENNCSPISNETEYFIVDIEVAGALPDARFDMLAVRWLRDERKKGGSLVPALIEMKYGTNALEGKSGLAGHLTQVNRISDECWNSLSKELEDQINQLADLDLLKFNRSSNIERLKVNTDATPELIFLLANYNPASTKLSKFLDNLKEPEGDDKKFDLIFFVSSFAGYGMHRACMLKLNEFKAMVTRLFESSTRS
jgi:hypothetical protein